MVNFSDKSENISGLSQEEVKKKLKIEGYNELPSRKKYGLFYLLLEVAKEPMLLLLIISGVIYLFLGNIEDAIMLVSFIVVVVGITIYQERKTEKAIEALKNLSSPRALVIRDGRQVNIPGREVVTGDILVLKEGNRVPADAFVFSSSNLLIDESLLTGESIPVRKSEADEDNFSQNIRPGGDDTPFVYSGTMIIQGHGMAKVIATGVNTEMGKIGKALKSIKDETTPLQIETRKIIKNMLIIGAFLCVAVVLIYGFTRGNWLKGFLAGLSLSMAMIPEEFSVVLLIFLTMGAWRISKKQVLTRKVSAIETLGSASVLCVDKTGTLTLNKMTLGKIYIENEYFDIENNKFNVVPEKFHNLLEYSILASQRDPFDPVESAIKKTGEKYLANSEHIHNYWKLVREYPLSKEIIALSHVWESVDKQNYIIAAKGAPESIIDLCHVDERKKDKLLKVVVELANEGYRVLGVAKATFSKINIPENQHDFNFEFIGFLGFIDPVRENVSDTIKVCYEAGIRVILITGDYPGTAQNIARQIGLKNPQKYILGTELEEMDTGKLKQKVKDVNIFARVVPEQKLLIVNAFKANGEIVAMTGDGVNDAPALKSANIGIAMGERGTDVARESASLVLLNDDFSSIVEAVKLGRRIFNNLKKAMSYIFSIHIPIALVSLIPVIFKLPLILMPAHIAFMELIIDPACSTVFEAQPENENIMKNKPRDLKESMFNKKTLLWSVINGISIFIITISVFIIALKRGASEDEARTLTFTALVLSNLALIATNTSWSKNIIKIFKSKNKSLYFVLGIALVLLSSILYIPDLRSLFHFSKLGIYDVLLCLSLGVAITLWFELLKLINIKIKFIR
ncbi:MAG: cation-translocating P-type ATPase [Actinobacteria bacterium]|nr:cation-translocating P-type ATPase [Actinomycetota bacterium]